ncbi:MAG: universal stress protein [Deltaproteobacteria bacterium]|nr:universal stress protein [Deltaproteobacteria bacterium]
MTPRHFLVCVDVNDDDDNGGVGLGLVERAARLADGLGARMTVVSVVRPVPVLPAPPLGDRSEAHWARADFATSVAERRRRTLLTLTDHARAFGLNPSSRLVEAEDHAADLLMAAAVDIGADLLVMGSHGRHGVGVLGSVAMRVAASSTVPVLIVPFERRRLRRAH